MIYLGSAVAILIAYVIGWFVGYDDALSVQAPGTVRDAYRQAEREGRR